MIWFKDSGPEQLDIKANNKHMAEGEIKQNVYFYAGLIL